MHVKIVVFFLFFFLSAGLIFLYYWGRPARVDMREEIYPCMIYYRRVHNKPRMFVAHIVTVDLKCKNSIVIKLVSFSAEPYA